ncbi:MAG: hypothetical protein ACRDUS_16325 [Mycobacterium sp.]
MPLTPADLKRVDVQMIRDVAAALEKQATSLGDIKNSFPYLPHVGNWTGVAASAADDELGVFGKLIGAHSEGRQAAAAKMRAAADEFEAAKTKLGKIENEAQGKFKIDYATGAVKPLSDKPADAQQAEELAAGIKRAVTDGDAADATLTHAVNLADGDEKPASLPMSMTGILGVLDANKDRIMSARENQDAAFREVFGRAPTTPADWATASMMDPHSYNPKNGGVPPEIRVAKIEPVPGQGVVRANWFIPSKEVLYPTYRDGKGIGHNFGDNRGFNAKFAPEDARVSAIVDYENGIVVVRQNPSVETDTGRAWAGSPWASVSQDTNGAVKLYYNTADPWAPGGEGISKLANYSVNGNVVVQPGAAGPSVGGQMTSFPAFEAYHDTPSGGTSQLAQVWPPGRADQLGPMTGLPFMQQVGDQGILHSMDGARMTELMPPDSRVPTITPAAPPTAQAPVPRTEIGK